MATSIDVGTFRIDALNDGTIRLPPMYYPGLDFDAHRGLLAADGTYHIPAGCFLIRGADVCILVDAGLGPAAIPFPPDIAATAGLHHPPEHIAEGGGLPDALAALKIAPSDIDIVFITHLHADHMGWVAPGGTLFFSKAEIVFGAAEDVPPVDPAPGELEGRAGLEIAKTAGVVHTIGSASYELAPGVVALHTPGHTAGHYVASVTSNGDEACLLGDLVHHPMQLDDPGISFISEKDPAPPLHAREQVLARYAGTRVSLGMAHLPGLNFQRITLENGRRRWTAAGD